MVTKKVILISLTTMFTIAFFSASGYATTKEPCAESLDKCPDIGCATPGSSEALSNTLKKRMVPVTNVRKITFVTLQKLQKIADEKVGQNHYPNKEERALLKSLNVNGKKVGEGDVVRLSGYIAGTPRSMGGESVNCRLTGKDNNDFHITLAEIAEPSQEGDEHESTVKEEDLEFQGVVVEMIPQQRPANWNIENLKDVKNQKKKVLVVGQLFYDSKHRVNNNPDKPIGGQPKRMTLWEIHPIYKFYVCDKIDNDCDEDKYKEWRELK